MIEAVDQHSIPTFYELDNYVPEVNRAVARNVNSDFLHFDFSEQAHLPINIKEYFDEVTFERAGVLSGEYALVNGLILVARDGACIKANMAVEDKWGGFEFADVHCTSETFSQLKQQILNEWDRITLVENPIVVSHLYANNYFHWSLETVTKNRFFTRDMHSPILVEEKHLHRLYQRNLLANSIGDRIIRTSKTTVTRVSDPKLSHEMMSEHSIHCLRDMMKIPVQSGGNRRIYLRRTPGKVRERTGGGICETAEFVIFLKEYGFESIDFSDQELTVEQQVRMLDNASVILAPHGAALTNLAYLNPPLSVIEIMGEKTPRALFMHIASVLKFHHYGVYSESVDTEDNIIVNVEELRAVMSNIASN